MSKNLCHRCGFECPHVEVGGIHWCPNCGLPISVSGDKVTYEFEKGCDICNLDGHPPKPGYMEPVPRGHLRHVLGLAPCVEDLENDVKEIQDS